MAWTAHVTVNEVTADHYTASGSATGTDDDTTVQSVEITVNTSAQTHLTVGQAIDLSSDC